MSKNSRNSGKFKQDAVLGQFRRDARSSNANCAVMQCMRKTAAPAKKETVRVSINALIRMQTGK